MSAILSVATSHIVDATLAADYAYYLVRVAERQAEADAFDAEFGLARIDLAWVETVARARRRAVPRNVDVVGQFRHQLALRRYAAAIEG